MTLFSKKTHPPDFTEIAIPVLVITLCTLFMLLCFFAPPPGGTRADDSDAPPSLSQWPFVDPTFRPTSPKTALGKLDWLCGDWKIESELETVRWSIQPAACKNYLLFTEEGTLRPSGKIYGVLHIIAFNPVSGLYDVSTFGTDGSFGTGRMTDVGGSLVATSQILLPDGAAATMTNIYTPGANGPIRRSQNRTLGGELLPNLGPNEAVRIAPFRFRAPVFYASESQK